MSVSGQMIRAPEGVTFCSMPGIAPASERSLSDADLLASYNSQAGLIQTVQGSVVVRAKGGPELGSKVRDSRPSPAILSFRAPASLRMTGVVPFSARRTFDIASDGREFRLLVPDGKIMRFFVGPVDAPPVSSNPRENLRAQPFLTVGGPAMFDRSMLFCSVRAKIAGRLGALSSICAGAQFRRSTSSTICRR
jgi:hypothetical protein